MTAASSLVLLSFLSFSTWQLLLIGGGQGFGAMPVLSISSCLHVSDKCFLSFHVEPYPLSGRSIFFFQFYLCLTLLPFAVRLHFHVGKRVPLYWLPPPWAHSEGRVTGQPQGFMAGIGACKVARPTYARQSDQNLTYSISCPFAFHPAFFRMHVMWERSQECTPPLWGGWLSALFFHMETNPFHGVGRCSPSSFLTILDLSMLYCCTC